MALRVVHAAGELHQSLLDHVAGNEVDGAGGVEVAELRMVGPLVHVNALNRFRDDEIQVGIALAVGMAAQIDRHVVHKERHVGPVVGIEAAKKILVRLAGPAGMLDGNEAGDQPQDLGRPALRLEQDFLVRDELL